jgi:septal ring-binding cell division protein DamX
MDHKRAMSSHLIIAALAATLSLNAWADIYKCKTPSGKTIISDTGCKDNSAAVAVHSSESLTQQQRIDAEAVQRRNKAQLETLENENTAWRNQPSPPSPVSPVAAGNTTAMDEEAIRLCVRDVERRGGPEKQKAELIAACRTAGPPATAADVGTAQGTDTTAPVGRWPGKTASRVRRLAQ